MATTEQFSLRWNNFHSNLTTGFHDLLEAADMVDVTLAVEGQFLQAHKIVLSICSPYFKQMFKLSPCKHPFIILKDVAHDNMKDILEFMYLGEVNVLRENLPSFLRTAELLQVKGLTGDDSQSESSSKRDDKTDSLGEADDDQEYNQIIEADATMLAQYGSPPHLPSSPLKQQSNAKRQARASLNSSNAKKTKSEANATNAGNKVGSPNKGKLSEHAKNDGEDCSTVPTVTVPATDPPCTIKTETPYEADGETKESTKGFETGVGSIGAGVETNLQDHDVVMYTVDEKGHAYCPYCFKKFVNRYNLKVHIRDKHDASSWNLDCVVCGKTMRNRSCLRVHMYHHRKQEQAKLEAAVIN